MAFEGLIAENWIFDTLAGDATLAAALALDGRAPGYQVGVYAHVAPERDTRSNRAPQTPYIVFSRLGSEAGDERTIGGCRVFTDPVYRVTVWDSGPGSVSTARLQTIADRIDTLLDNVATGTTPPGYCNRIGTEIPVVVQTDGGVDYGLSATYSIRLQPSI